MAFHMACSSNYIVVFVWGGVIRNYEMLQFYLLIGILIFTFYRLTLISFKENIDSYIHTFQDNVSVIQF